MINFLSVCLTYGQVKMNTLAKKFAFVAIFTALTATANAASLYCNGGKVASLSYHGKGTIYLKMSNMNTPVGICNLDADWGPTGSMTGVTSPSSCKAIYAALLAAKHAGNTIPQLLFDGDSVPTSCTTFAHWSQVNLRFMEI